MLKGTARSPPLHAAITGRLPALCALLLEQGADVNEVDHLLRTPLHLAAQDNNVEMCQELIKRGADVNAIDSVLQTPLHMTASGDHLTICWLLLENDANVDAEDSAGKTPLHYALRNKQYGVARVLTYYGANLEAVSSEGRTPLDETDRATSLALQNLQKQELEMVVLRAVDLHHATGSTNNDTYVVYELRPPLTKEVQQVATPSIPKQDSPQYQHVYKIPVLRKASFLSFLKSGHVVMQVYQRRLFRKDKLVGETVIALRDLGIEGEIRGSFDIASQGKITNSRLEVICRLAAAEKGTEKGVPRAASRSRSVNSQSKGKSPPQQPQQPPQYQQQSQQQQQQQHSPSDNGGTFTLRSPSATTHSAAVASSPPHLPASVPSPTLRGTSDLSPLPSRKSLSPLPAVSSSRWSDQQPVTASHRAPSPISEDEELRALPLTPDSHLQSSFPYTARTMSASTGRGTAASMQPSLPTTNPEPVFPTARTTSSAVTASSGLRSARPAILTSQLPVTPALPPDPVLTPPLPPPPASQDMKTVATTTSPRVAPISTTTTVPGSNRIINMPDNTLLRRPDFPRPSFIPASTAPAPHSSSPTSSSSHIPAQSPPQPPSQSPPQQLHSSPENNLSNTRPIMRSSEIPTPPQGSPREKVSPQLDRRIASTSRLFKSSPPSSPDSPKPLSPPAVSEPGAGKQERSKQEMLLHAQLETFRTQCQKQEAELHWLRQQQRVAPPRRRDSEELMREGFELKLSSLENEVSHLRQQLNETQSRITQLQSSERQLHDLLEAERQKNSQLWEQLKRAAESGGEVNQLKSDLKLQRDRLKRQEEENARLSKLYRQAKAMNLELDRRNAELDRENRRMPEAAHYSEMVAMRAQQASLDLKQRLTSESSPRE